MLFQLPQLVFYAFFQSFSFLQQIPSCQKNHLFFSRHPNHLLSGHTSKEYSYPTHKPILHSVSYTASLPDESDSAFSFLLLSVHIKNLIKSQEMSYHR